MAFDMMSSATKVVAYLQRTVQELRSENSALKAKVASLETEKAVLKQAAGNRYEASSNAHGTGLLKRPVSF